MLLLNYNAYKGFPFIQKGAKYGKRFKWKGNRTRHFTKEKR